MASGSAALKAAAVVAVFAMLLLPSLGHRKSGPLCSDCPSQCSINCTAIAAQNCTSYCSVPEPSCSDCVTAVRQRCRDCCNNVCTGANCQPSCICDCGNVDTLDCRFACKINDGQCQACKTVLGQQCNTSCISVCNANCVKKEKCHH